MTANDEAIICLSDVSKRYWRGEVAHEVISGVSFTVHASEFVSIVGPSGCGKSTLLSIIAGLEPATGGTVELRRQQLKSLAQGIGFAFQHDALLPWRTAAQNVALPLRFRGVSKAEARERAMFWLGRVGLSHHVHKYPRQLSGGMRKRVAMAVMLAYEPDVLLLDEPFSALDVQTRSLLENDLLDYCGSSGQTVVLITHDLEEAIAMSDRVIVMSSGPGRVIGDHRVTLPKPRDVFEAKNDPAFAETHALLWDQLRDEVRLTSARELNAGYA